jgi:hypothetical protein
MGQLTIHFVGDGALLQHHHDVSWIFRQLRYIEIDQPFARIARSCQINLVFVDRRAATTHLLYQREQGGTERYKLAQRVPAQHCRGCFEELFRRDIGIRNSSIGRYHDHRVWQCVQQRVGGAADDRRDRLGAPHAAALQTKSS